MTVGPRTPSQTEVLDTFAVEPTHDRRTLERYLRSYPQFASALCQLSFELNRTDLVEGPLTAADETLVARAWSRRVALDGSHAENPLASLSPIERRSVARDLGIKVQIITLFREARIAIDTVPISFMRRFADRLRTGVDALAMGLSVPAPATAQAFKANGKPAANRGVGFERALRESGATDDEIAALLQDS